MQPKHAAPIAAGAAVASSAAAGAASAAACTAAAAALTAAAAACAASTIACFDCASRIPAALRTRDRKVRELEDELPGRDEEDDAGMPPPISARSLSTIEADDDLLPRARAAQHVLHAIAEANEPLLTDAVMARVGWDATLTQPTGSIPAWAFAGHHFAQSGAVAVAGVATVAAAPLSLPSNAVVGAALAISHGAALLAGAKGEAQRALEQEQFRLRYALRREELKWSLVPVATLYWDLRDGDDVFTLALKAKRGALGLGQTDAMATLKLRRLLCRLLDAHPGLTSEKAARVAVAIARVTPPRTKPEPQRASDRSCIPTCEVCAFLARAGRRRHVPRRRGQGERALQGFSRRGLRFGPSESVGVARVRVSVSRS